ncbi:hypothetical protein Cgig2_030869 [Carnegiea gigantea]|uniref:Uncharacterized protein n=1 Tax=Carnegiea gigantea TaxID=171969 RepID=A0A9Q1QIT9_9CARY|nr:hypothetical protein Cgig2_030869 [Carnegiea gigantea]
MVNNLIYFAFGINTLVIGNSNPYLRLISVSSACVMVSASVQLVRPFYKNGRRCGGIFCRHIGVRTSDAIFTLRQVKEPIIQSLMPHKSAVVRKDRIVLLRIRSALVYLETQLVFRNFPRALLMCIVVALVANLLQSAPSSTSKWTTFPSHQWLVLVTAILEKVNKNLVLTSSTLEEAGDTTVSCQKKLLVQYPIAVFEKVIDSCCWESRIFFKHDLQPYDLLSALKQGACKCGRCGAVFCRHRGVQTYCAIFTLRQVKEPVLRSLKPQKSPAVQKDRSVLLLIR